MLDAFNIWDLFIGIVSLLTSVPIVYHCVTRQLPSRKLRALFDTLSETETLYTSCIEEGLLKEYEARTFSKNISALRRRATDIRVLVHSAKTYGDDFKNLVQGVTRRINRLCKDIKKVRSKISTTSNRERERRQRADAQRRITQDNHAADGDFVALSDTVSWWNPWTYIKCCIDLMSCGCPSRDEDEDVDVPPHEAQQVPPCAEVVVHQPTSTQISAPHLLTPSALPLLSSRPQEEPSSFEPISAKHGTARARPPSVTSSVSQQSSSTASTRWKIHSTPLSRARALSRHLRRSRIARSRALSQAVTLISLKEAAYLPELPYVDDDPEWEDLNSVTVQVA
ncbi:hypothetical protein GY45DRAFT_1323704 [Cubamyces sp. BRFM 1775]|nr:hypothetical protein GY45DRAFT_1323704 [Cubamyces sp. BRFM 1775]